MAQDFGNGVSRTLSALQRQFQSVVWQASKPPLDSELNLMSQVEWERVSNIVRSQMHSGFLLDPMSADMDFVTNENWSNWFKLGRPDAGEDAPLVWANVNGWLVPVVGTGVDEGDVSNRINVFPPPSTQARIDFVFLEVWQGQIAPNPSETDKPSASTIWKYGNVLYGGTNIDDDMEDPTIGFETTERVQIQYRLRVVGSGTGLGDSVDLGQYPDGLDDPNVLAQGAESSPVTGYAWTNMRDTLGDAGLWRSGAGDATSRAALGTVDGYSYAIPVCALFRRNENVFVARTASGNANQNGTFNRNPTSASITDPVEGTRTFTSVTLTDVLPAPTSTDSAVGVISVTGLADSGLDNVSIDWSGTFLMLDDEILGIEAVDASAGTIQISDPDDASTPRQGRGRYGTQPAYHAAGTAFSFFCFRPDGLFADQITASDIVDLRRGVTAGEWSYKDILEHNLGKLLRGTLHTCYKQGSGTDTQGAEIIEVDTLLGQSAGTLPNQNEQLDGFDGIRTVFSDAAMVQNDISLLLTAPTGAGTISSYTSVNSWDVAAGFAPDGFTPVGSGWENGTTINLYLGGGSSGSEGARATSEDGDRFMRFVTPREYWLNRDEAFMTGTPSATSSSVNLGAHGNQMPFLLRFIEEAWSNPAGQGETASAHPGPMFPLPEFNFERPFIVLGGVANSNLNSTSATTNIDGTNNEILFTGLDFDTAGGWYPSTGVASLGTTGITNLLLHDTRNLYDLLTAGGKDRSGSSSELYLVLSGDTANPGNNGCFRVIGAGSSAGYTDKNASAADTLLVEQVGESTGTFVTAITITAQARTQYMSTEDGPSTNPSAALIVITDIEGTASSTSNPWNGLVTTASTSELVVDTSVLYGPSRGGTARVADDISRFALVAPTGVNLLREAPENLDTDFRTDTGVPADEHYFPDQPIQTWNRLPSLGLHAPLAPDYGDGRYVFDTRRESELFVDEGSKTVMFRPFQLVDMTLYERTSLGTAQIPSSWGSVATTDGAAIWNASLDDVFAIPPEYMPRFGRQDIPVHQTSGTTGPVFFGINHLFGDDYSTDGTEVVFAIIGGTNTGGGAPTTIHFKTGTSAPVLDYGEYNSSDTVYQARLYEDVNSRSADINKPLRGIQLPPFFGVARVFGVYDKRDFDTNGSGWTDRGFTPGTGGVGTNLIRTDADKQTLFIIKDGAFDVTAHTGDHTYLIPEEAINIELSPDFTVGETFNDLEYVVECAVFGFARDFINENNYVVARRDYTVSTNPMPLVGMVLPAAMPGGHQGYAAYQRTVYQGDPYMTRDGATLQTADYEQRYGQIPVSDAFDVTAPIQQYNSANDQIPEIPNARALEVLSSVDFWTTLGTGKMGGPVYAGTPMDVGHLTSSATRLPAATDSNPDQPHVRTFTQPQPITAPHAEMSVVIYDNADLITNGNAGVRVQRGDATETALGGAAFTVGLDAEESAKSLAEHFQSGTATAIGNNVLGVSVLNIGNRVVFRSWLAGEAGADTIVSLVPDASTGSYAGLVLETTPDYAFRGGTGSAQIGRQDRTPLAGGVNVPVRGARSSVAHTPEQLSGMTERLPLGILVQDSDFLGEDPAREGAAYQITSGGGSSATSQMSYPWERDLIGPAGYLGMADGAILEYDGTVALKFRLFRGGGSVYVLQDGSPGSPVDFSSGGFPTNPILKGAVLVGRAYLVRNHEESAFSSNAVRSYGDEVQMVVITNAVYGTGLACDDGYALDGVISPTGYGKGYAASDRYRLEGKPLIKGRAAGPNPDVSLAPYPPEDPADDDPCA